MLVFLSIYNKSKIDKLYSSEEYISNITYSKGNVYICNSKDEVEQIKLFCNDEDVIVLDQTFYKDPNVKIVSSYKISDKDDMYAILSIIKEYFSNNENGWDRSLYSMENEWIIHNICSNMFILKSSTDDVDLNNRDENIYNIKILGSIIGNKHK